MHSSEFEEEFDEVRNTIEEDKAVNESLGFNCKVTVGNFKTKSSSEIHESFLKQFDGVVMVKPEVKSTRKEGKGAVEVFEGSYEVTFKDSSSAEKFIKLEEAKFEERALSRKLLYSCIYCSRSFKFLHYLRTHIARLHISTMHAQRKYYERIIWKTTNKSTMLRLPMFVYLARKHLKQVWLW